MQDLVNRANLGDVDAQSKIDSALGASPGTYVKTIKEAENFKLLAEQGDVIAMVGLGHAYYMGMCVEKDLDMAEHWYEKAAARGSGDALFRLANICFCNYDDMKKAKEYLERALASGDAKDIPMDVVDEMMKYIATVEITGEEVDYMARCPHPNEKAIAHCDTCGIGLCKKCFDSGSDGSWFGIAYKDGDARCEPCAKNNMRRTMPDEMVRYVITYWQKTLSGWKYTGE